MKKTLILAPMVFGVGLLLLAGSALATDYSMTVTPGSGINGTAHDLRPGQPAAAYNPRDIDNEYDGGAGGDLNRICVWCHAPHHTLKPAEYAGELDYLPLWNHTVTTMDFQPYTNGADEPADASHMSTAEMQANQPGSVSKLCLSCHDGSVAVNEYGFMPGDIKSSGTRKGDAPVYIVGQYRIGAGGDMTNHHPIGFKYVDVATVDDEIASPTAAIGYYEIGDLLWGGRMECTTCHDVHNTKNQGEKFLWISDRNSNFCLTCHLKGQKTL